MEEPGSSVPPYDFHRCKLCGGRTASPLYRLGERTVYGCSACDFHALDVLDALPAAGAETKGGLDRKAQEYIEERLAAHDPVPELRLELIREHIPLAGAHCLDVGAGVGEFVQRLASEGALADGLEPSPMRRDFARLKLGVALNAETIERFSRHGEYAGFFDVVTLWDVIEHVNFPVETLSAARRVLKDGGFLFIATPSRDSLPYRLSELTYRLSRGRLPLFLPDFYSPAPFGHKQIFRPVQLMRLAEKTDFDVVELGPGLRRDRIVLTCRKPSFRG